MTFTIAVPTYKVRYLKECIDSVLAQTYSNFEVVIVNDASPEDLDSVVSQFHDDRIRYFKNEKNFGAVNVVGNWNRCLEYAKGDYIICMGDDDKLLPTCLENYAKLIEKYPDVDVLHTRTQMIDENSEVFKLQGYRPEWESVYSLIYWRWQGRLQYIGDFLYKISTLRKNGGFFNLPCAWGSDDISAVIAAKEHGIINMQEYGFQYRINRYTISNTSSFERNKCQANKQQKEWYRQFLASCQPSCSEDLVYLTMLKDMLDKHFRKAQQGNVTRDLKFHRLTGVFYWLHNKTTYNIDNKLVFKSLLKSFI